MSISEGENVKGRYLITTPIYYVNDKPHIGHAYTTIAADVLSRFHRLKGEQTFFLTGTDEHGSKVAEAAEKAGISPQQLCDKNSQFFRNAWQELNISYDYFVRTTDQRHIQAVTVLLNKLFSAKDQKGEKVVYSGEYSGLYCVGCEKFITEKDLVDGLCPSHLKPPQSLTEKNYFFRLSSYLPLVQKLISEDKIRILPEEKKNETLGLFKQGLEDFSISREKVTWGVTLPFDPSQKAYVWVDALPNYISAIGYGDNPEEFKKWWSGGKVIHLIGKDILKFHNIYWPAMLLAAGEKTPDLLFVHGYFTVDGQKMGKSLGNVIDPHRLIEKYGSDATRYLLLTQFPFGQDGDIQEKRLENKYNSDLANDFGNLASRVLKLIKENFSGEIPEPEDYQKEEKELQAQAVDTVRKVFDYIEEISINQGIDEILKLVRLTNRYVDKTAPWNLAKAGDKSRLRTVLYTSAETIRVISLLFYPVIPQKASKLRETLGFKEKELIPSLEKEKDWGYLKPGTKIGEITALFPRLSEKEKKAVEISKEKKMENQISIEEFAKLDFRVAKVLEAERVEGAKKLLKLKVEFGEEKREIVAGIAEHYKPEDLSGKTIILLTNLKPARIRGIESNGMLLAASEGGNLVLLTTDKEINPGAKIS
ncbi:MAG: methionine--tRNA ligase [candidate division Zixibacteria bacterium]|nr:methionine--tRNA ligase [candidate division Zixibacteria bacterium]